MNCARRLSLVLGGMLLSALLILPSGGQAQAQVSSSAAFAALPLVKQAGAQVNTYAAIAYSPSTGQVGYGANYRRLADAEYAALASCGAEDAQLIVSVRNGWAALALGDDPGAFGWAYAADRGTAMRNALRSCQQQTTNCYIALCVSSRG